jgi:hypothetical protein
LLPPEVLRSGLLRSAQVLRSGLLEISSLKSRSDSFSIPIRNVPKP